MGAVRSFRLTPLAYRRITLVALLALCVIIVTGGAVRLTGSGLGCTDWPYCERDQFVAPAEYHAWVEFGNRLFTGVVSVAVILAVLGSFIRVPRRRELTWWSVGLVVGVLAQIVLGAIVVKTDLIPGAVSAHFLVSMALVWNAVVLHVRASEGDGPPVRVVAAVVHRLTVAVIVLLPVVLFLGTLVTGSGPHSGDAGHVDRLGFDIRSITRAHSGAVWMLVVAAVAAVAAAMRTRAPVRVRSWGVGLLAALVAQGAIGYLQYFNGVPVALVAVHLVGAVTVWVVALQFLLAQRERTDVAVAAAAAAQ